jgi:hypothetical protein
VATVIEITTDPYKDNLDIAGLRNEFLDPWAGVRRPLRGIEIKDDTYGQIRVIDSDGLVLPLTDAGGPNSSTSKSGQAGSGVAYDQGNYPRAHTYDYSNFIIQRVEDNRQEKSQILETFGDSYIFFFGERPRVLSVSGLLFNTRDFNWRAEFWYNYENLLRGTQLVKRGARIYLHWDDIIVEGYMLGANATDDASMPYHIPFNFQLFVTSHMYLSQVGNADYPIVSSVLIDPLNLKKEGRNQVLSAKAELKKNAIVPKEYESTVNAVRIQHEQSEAASETRSLITALNEGKTPEQAEAGWGQKFNAGKNILANALAIGVNAQNLTFLSVANNFFRNRKMRFPRGLAGSEAYAGPTTVTPQARYMRSKPLRGKIKDNTDEYIGGAPEKPVLDQDALDEATTRMQHKNKYEMEKAALQKLEAMGLDPVQHPGGSPFQADHAIEVMGFNPTDLAEWSPF